MIGKLTSFVVISSMALAVLFVTFYKSSETLYSFKYQKIALNNVYRAIYIPYDLPKPGPLLPGNILWPGRVAFDKSKVFFALNSYEKSQIYQQISDQRLSAAQKLFKRGDFELSVTTIEKSEKYLELALLEEKNAHKQGINTVDLLGNISKASLKHREIIEDMALNSPEDARPMVNKTLDITKKLFEETKIALNEQKAPTFTNPFE